MQQYYGNPYYPQANYPPPMQDNLAQLRQPMMQQQQSSMQWVSCEQEARNFLVAPNSAVALWDSSGPRVYLKQTDASGKPLFKGYDLVERSESAPAAPEAAPPNYVTREEFDALAASVREMKGKKKRKVEENDDDE